MYEQESIKTINSINSIKSAKRGGNYLKRNKTIRYRTYKRGQIVLVNFRPSTGSELRGKHFAIVLNKNDFPGNGVLTVIPLSSKEKNYYVSLGTEFSESIENLLKTKTIEIVKKGGNSEITLEESMDIFRDISYHHQHFSTKTQVSYAMVQNITTVSKFKVNKYTKVFDPLKLFRLSDNMLDKIDRKIIELFTSDSKESDFDN